MIKPPIFPISCFPTLFSKRALIRFILLAFVVNTFGLPFAQAQDFRLPVPGAMVNLSPAYVPVLIKGLKVHPENPLLFDFILDTGKSGLKINSPAFKVESEKLIRYFLASLTIKEDDLWVNLSPYEKNRIIPDQLGQTELGRDMLAQDYILKQLTASLIYPEKQLGKEFWDTVYAKAQQEFGTSDIPVNTFNKVWIIADKAKILERNNVGYVVGAHLKVMLEEDYLALKNHTAIGQVSKTHTVASQVVREIIIPAIDKEVNQGRNFAPLRQMFYSMILASWYKLDLKDALLNQVYSNKEKTGGILSDDPVAKEKIFQRYLQAYKKGVFNFIREEIPLGTSGSESKRQGILPRKYFSGGLRVFPHTPEVEKNLAKGDDAMVIGDMAMETVGMAEQVSQNFDAAMTQAEQVKNIWSIYKWLAQRDRLPDDYNLLWIGGSKFFPPIQQVIQLYQEKPVKIMIAGGIGRDTAKFNALGLDWEAREELVKILDSLAKIKETEGSDRLWEYIGKKFHIQRGRDNQIIRERQTGTLQPGHLEWRAFYKMLNGNNPDIEKELAEMDREHITIEEHLINQLIDHKTRNDALVPEALTYYAILIANGVKDEDIFVDAQSTTGLENVTYGAKVLNENHFIPTNIISIHYDDVQRRTRAALEQQLPAHLNHWFPHQNHVYAYAPRVFKFEDLEAMPNAQLNALQQSLVVEVNKLPGLFENGSIVKIDVPADIEEAKATLDSAMTVNSTRILSRVNHKMSTVLFNGHSTPGGIDLNAKNMSLDITGNGIEMKFDPAMVAEFRRGNFSGIVANIIRITPIKSPLPMMGLETSQI